MIIMVSIKHGLAADLIPEMPKDCPTERPRNEPDRVGAEGSKSAHEWIETRKNSLLNTSSAAVPYSRKSYHSIIVPMTLAPTI
jgi:hypothetical protein